LNEDDIKQAQQRKGSYDQLDQEMGGQDPSTQIDSSAMASAFSKLESKPNNLTNMFDNMQIAVVGGKPEEMKSEVGSSDNESEDEVTDEHFLEDANKVSQKH